MYPVTQPNPKGFSITSVVKVQNVSRLCLARHNESLITYYYDWKPALTIMPACLFENYTFYCTARSEVSILQATVTQQRKNRKMLNEWFNLVEDAR